MRIILKCLFVCFIVAALHEAAAQTPPFPFGNGTTDIYVARSDGNLVTDYYPLPKPISFYSYILSNVALNVNGYIAFLRDGQFIAAAVNGYYMDLDTRNGGENQNEVWFRFGSNIADLNLARDIIAGTGTLFSPQAIIVATWYKVEANPQRAGPQNTFQVAIPYSDTGETWVIFMYSQLEYYQSGGFNPNVSFVRYGPFVNPDFQWETVVEVNSNATMKFLLTSSNCNRKGVYAYQINAGTTKAPTNAPTTMPSKAPTETPTKAPIDALTAAPTTAPSLQTCGLFGWSIFCPFTFCGVFGRWLGFCQST